MLAVVAYGLSWNKGALARWLSRPSLQQSGRSSYSLYMTHGVVLFAMRYFFYAPELAQSSVVLRIGLLCWYVATIAAVAEVTYAYVEEPARRWMAARFLDRLEIAARPDLSARPA